MRNVDLTVGAAPIGEGPTWAYPSGAKLGVFITPIYTMKIAGKDSAGKAVLTTVPVYRFGVQSEDGKTARVVGLADFQSYTIKAWIPTYHVHSANSPENGAWQVTGNFLIHDGPDDNTELFATIGCIEVRGPQGFVKFNNLLIDLMDPPGATRDQQLAAIGKSGLLRITYLAAARPPLKKQS